MPPVSANTRHGNASGSSLLSSARDSTARTSPELSIMPRRLFSSPDTADKDADAASYSSDPEEIESRMKRPGPMGRVLPPTAADVAAMDEKEYLNLMAELRATADKILREDEWKFRSSDLILGFRD
ncbi:hypothetical protein BV898_04865 [Hypsibius exemplaris]|uniref:Uncharacterized protein n=1 Tax=Hypsibius exemplaris TaxID=2072580 RepID=A0A1W0X0Y2_HYPEX|nr:hypothetical protein BV898_04865 [Hypsibius exemplaris]